MCATWGGARFGQELTDFLPFWDQLDFWSQIPNSFIYENTQKIQFF